MIGDGLLRDAACCFTARLQFVAQTKDCTIPKNILQSIKEHLQPPTPPLLPPPPPPRHLQAFCSGPLNCCSLFMV